MAAAMEVEAMDPQSRVKSLSNCAAEVEVDHNIPARRYFRSAVEMERMANVYYSEGNYESAFVLYSRFITLFVEKLPKHPEYSAAPQGEKTACRKKLKNIFPKAEELKQKISEKYAAEWKQAVEKRKQEEAAKEKERKENEERIKREEAERKLREAQSLPALTPTQDQSSALKDTTPAEYPLAPTLGEGIKNGPTPTALPFTPSSPPPSTVPSAPPAYSLLPPEASQPSVGLYSIDTNVSTPSVDRSTKPASLSTGSVLRGVSVPSELPSRFLHIASPNTRQNLETCGILAGTLKQDRFCVTHLVIPKQSATSDSCSTSNEEEMFEIQDAYDLITLGWIHTHPSQSSFLSSIDLHTHCSYQLMMPEAIAIVCAPKFGQTGIYRLTQDYGLKFIASCRQPGFHPHPKEPPLYEDCGHVHMDPNHRIEVIDLR